MQLIDTHCHLTFDALADDVPGVVERSQAAGVTSWICVGVDLEHTERAVALAEQYDNMYATAGLHPHDAKDLTGQTLSRLKELAQHLKVVAVGETGLDFHYNYSKPDAQRRAFVAQIEIAKEMNLPLIVHSREAFDETFEALKEHGQGLKGVVFHCFGGTAEQARRILDWGYHISFTGVVTFKNARTTRQAALAVPLDRLMLETDCPFMSPEPMRKQRTNEPALLIHTAKFLAELRQTDLHDLAAATTATARRFLDLPGQGT